MLQSFGFHPDVRRFSPAGIKGEKDFSEVVRATARLSSPKSAPA
jgi:hypothetical protein